MSANVIYHLAPKVSVDEQRESGVYRTADLSSIGFIHCTKQPGTLLQVANHFYRGVSGDFVVMEIDEDRLDAEVKYEKPAPVGDIQSDSSKVQEDSFPHVFGPINFTAVVRTFPATRDDTGTFLSVTSD